MITLAIMVTLPLPDAPSFIACPNPLKLGMADVSVLRQFHVSDELELTMWVRMASNF